jgi:plastocyanin domain-containing protein
MYLYAMGTGNFFSGMSSLAAFGLGTLPVMIGFGSIATSISHKTTKKILKIAAILVLILGIIMLNRGLTVLGSPISFDSIKEIAVKPETGKVILREGYQEINMEVTRSGWQPNSFVLKKGVPVKWNINVKELTGCNNEIIVPEYDLDIKLKKGLNVAEFTPTKTGTIRWSCWMGMIPGSFVVTETGQASQQEIAQATPKNEGGGCGCGG